MVADSTFLAAARSGRNGWRRYLLGTAVMTFGTVIALVVPLFVLLFVLLVIAGIVYPPLLNSPSSRNLGNAFFDSRFFGFQFGYFFLIGLLTVIFLVAIVFVLESIHQRRWQTLLGPEDNALSVKRILQGFGVSFIFLLVKQLAFYLLMPDRYKVVFNATEWLVSLPFSFLLEVFGALIAGLLYGYWLQGLGLLVPQPGRLIILCGLLFGTMAFLLGTDKTPLTWVWVVLRLMFIAWVVLKDNRLELVIGSAMGNRFYFSSILKAGSARMQSPTVFERVGEPMLMLDLLSLIIYVALFYFIFFRSRPGKSPNSL